MATTAINNWDFHNSHVQDDLEGGDFVNAATTLIAAGPPDIRFAGNSSATLSEQTRARSEELNAVAYPIGVVENLAIGQARALQQIFEIGSKRSYFIPGRNVIRINLARVLYNGPSLIRVLYAFYPASKINATVANLLATGAGRANISAPQLRSNPGYADAFFNLDSDLCDQPLGLMILMVDSLVRPYGAIYLEICYIETHNLGLNSTSNLIAEGTALRADRIVPIDTGAVARQVTRSRGLEEQSVLGF